jgi:sugar lactone lactonase YvrE
LASAPTIFDDRSGAAGDDHQGHQWTACIGATATGRIRRFHVNRLCNGSGREIDPGRHSDAADDFNHGNLWCGWGMGTAELDGVFIYSPEGKLIGRISLPERCANLCFGGAKRNRLFIAASKSLYSLYVNTQGAPGD